MRNLLERLSRNWVFRRRLSADFGHVPFVTSTSGGLRYLIKSASELDPMLLKVVKLYVKPGDVVWDVGANVGLFSTASAFVAGKTGSIYSFEPDVWLVNLLRKTSRIQPESSAKIEVIPVGIAESVGIKRFAIANRSRATNFIDGYGSTQTGGVREWTSIYCTTLDWLTSSLSAPDFIKIDVEGAEKLVLEGGASCISTCRPKVLIEVSQSNSEFVTQFFTSRDYKLYDADSIVDALLEVSEAKPNTLAIPS